MGDAGLKGRSAAIAACSLVCRCGQSALGQAVAVGDAQSDTVDAAARDTADAASIDARDTVADFAAAAAPDAAPPADAQIGDVVDAAPIPDDVAWSSPAWTSTCVPDGSTATTLGPVGPVPSGCTPHACALCGPSDPCTCEGDGNTGHDIFGGVTVGVGAQVLVPPP